MFMVLASSTSVMVIVGIDRHCGCGGDGRSFSWMDGQCERRWKWCDQ